MTGFKFDEVMTGHHVIWADLDERRRPMEFRVRWGGSLADLLGILTGSAILPLEGVMTAEGIATDQPCRGTLELAYREGRVTYRIEFEGLARGRPQPLIFVGSKIGIRPWNLYRSHTTCYGTIRTAGGRIVSDSVTRFRLRTLPAFLASFRLMR